MGRLLLRNVILTLPESEILKEGVGARDRIPRPKPETLNRTPHNLPKNKPTYQRPQRPHFSESTLLHLEPRSHAPLLPIMANYLCAYVTVTSHNITEVCLFNTLLARDHNYSCIRHRALYFNRFKRFRNYTV